MIKQWSVSNFKSIKNKIALDFRPLTLFVGQNSSGKSTLIQSILLTAQTLQNNVASRSVVLNGKILRLGDFSDIRSNDSDVRDILVSFQLQKPTFDTDQLSSFGLRYYYLKELQEKMNYVSCSYSFSAAGETPDEKEYQLQPRLEGGTLGYNGLNQELNFEFEYSRIAGNPATLLQKMEVNAESAQIPDYSILSFQITSDPKKSYRNVFGFNDPSKPAGVQFKHFLPSEVALSYDAVELEITTVYENLVYGKFHFEYSSYVRQNRFNPLSNSKIDKIFTDACLQSLQNNSQFVQSNLKKCLAELRVDFNPRTMNQVHALLFPEGRKQLAIFLGTKEKEIRTILRAEREGRNEISMFPLADSINFAKAFVSDFFVDKVKYLGPLRDEPKAIYPIPGYNDPKDVGYKGEFTAAVLENNKNSIVRFIPSKNFPFSNKEKVFAGNGTLHQAVSDWLGYLGIANQVKTEDKGKLGHEMTITTPSSSYLHDLTHVGVGVSQALPIVVSSLLADAGSTLIFEQPELHLHPKVQTRLADFFMSLVFAGKQCIVETHSEYLISRLRYLSAMADDVEISKQIKMYFVEKPDSQSVYSEVLMSDTGVIKNWPPGFFDETEINSASIIQAQIAKAKLRRRIIRKGDET